MKLNDQIIQSAETRDKSYKLFDGQGLYIEISSKGSKFWRLKYRFEGKEKRISLGAYPDVSVEAAEKTLLVWNSYDGIWNKLSVGATTWTEHGGLAGVTAGAALTKTSNTLDVNVDNSTIEVNNDQLRVADSGITAQKLAGNIPADKLQLGDGVQEDGGELTLLLD
ncbi:MAG: DUF4102 domain-containing protein, partial [Gammaproteobacteria bacterium]|nr:DUF4102 domain-containing protein [Gammaproteobacteria bacterium]